MVKATRVLVIVGLIIAGLWLAGRSVRPAAESSARISALQMAAPAAREGQSVNAQLVPDAVIVEATAVDVSTIPPGVYDPNNQYDRWQRGEIDLMENEGIVPEAEMEALRRASEHLPASGNIAQAQAADGPASNAPTAGVAFDSIDYTECCGGGGNVPPDPELAVGPNHAIAVVNVAFEIYNKSGTSLVGPTTFSSFFAVNANCTGVFDPNALYDEETGRYILGIDADGDYYCLAVSQTGNPTGSWWVYAFPTASGSDFFDYPHAGVGRDAIYMGANIFGTTSFKESRVWAFDKTAMYSGNPAASVSKALPDSEDTPQPLHLHGFAQGTWPSSGPHYFFTETDYDGAQYSVWSWNNPFGGTSPSKVGTVNLVTATGVAAGMPLNVPQSGGSTIQGNDYRPQDFEYRNGYAWSVSTIACNPGGGTVNCIRWAKINPATATVVDAGVYGSNGQYRFFGDLAVNHCNDMAVGYTKSSTSMWPSIFYTGRKAGDAAGTLQAEAQLKAGEIAYTAFDSIPRRWGDYTEMTIAPDGVTFWYLGEYSKNTGTTSGRWGTYIGSFTYADCTTGGPTPTPTNTPIGPTPTNTAIPPTPTNTPPANSTVLHVADLDGSAVLTNNGNRWKATVTIKVVNAGNQPVSGVKVKVQWSNGATGNVTCTTNTSGICSVVKTRIAKNKASVRLTVKNLIKSGYTYNGSANTDPDSDSNGTWITVFKP
ncbi:MAG: Ig-like domain-containing protein [Chloroflexota bacterium]